MELLRIVLIVVLVLYSFILVGWLGEFDRAAFGERHGNRLTVLEVLILTLIVFAFRFASLVLGATIQSCFSVL